MGAGIKNNSMKNFILITILFSLTYCTVQQIKRDKIKSFYDYEVLYNYQGKERIEDKYRFRFSDKSLYVIIESSFKKDSIEIISDKKDLSFREVVDTEPSAGIAKTFVFKDFSEISNLKIRLNSSPWIYLDVTKKENNIIGIMKDDDKVEIVFYKKIPVFY